MTVFIIVGLVLVLAIAGLLLRVTKLVEVLRSSENQRVDGANKINAILFPIFLVLGLLGFYWISDYAVQFYLPEASSEHGQSIDDMFWFTMIILTIVFVATHLLLFTFPYIYQFKESRKATFFPDNHKLELIWTVVPGIVLALLVFTGYSVWTDITYDKPGVKYEVVEIVGKQFNWMVRYPGADNNLGKHNFRMTDETNIVGIDFNDVNAADDFMSQKVVVPKGKPVMLKIRSRDVLHSVFAFHFRQKMDAVPGMPTSFQFTPTKTTAEMRAELGKADFDYEIACTEVCGRGHFGMRMVIEVMEPRDYAKWKASQKSFIVSNPEYIAKLAPSVQERLKKLLPVEAAPAPAAEISSTKTETPAVEQPVIQKAGI
ncbi:MAG: cytochrome c oxidase subunit II [Flexibacteraceae bacterium]